MNSHERKGKSWGFCSGPCLAPLEVETDCQKEYSVFFAEMPRFSHVHFHIVPRAADLPAELRGGRVFAFLKAPPAEVIAPELVAEFCTRVSHQVRQQLDQDSE